MSTSIFLTFEPLTQRHLSSCIDLAATAPDPWSAKDVTAEMKSRARASYLAISKNGVAGFAFFTIEPDYAILTQIVIDPTQKQQGIGTALLQHALEKLAEQEIPRVILEVRQSNTPALALYKKLGFVEIANRPALYKNPSEDGFTMEKILFSSEP